MILCGCIRRLRQSKGWSLYRLAKEAGVSRSYLAAVEHGENVSLRTLAKLLHALEVEEAVLTPSEGGFRMALKAGSFVSGAFSRRAGRRKSPESK